MESLMKMLGGLILICIFMLYASFSYGLVVYKFWYWFIAPVFTITNITYYQAVGIGIFLGLFKNHEAETLSIDGVEVKKNINWGVGILLPFIILFIGWFIHLFIK